MKKLSIFCTKALPMFIDDQVTQDIQAYRSEFRGRDSSAQMLVSCSPVAQR